MSISDFGQVPGGMKRLREGEDKEPPSKRVKYAFDDAWKEIHQITALPPDEIQKELPRLTRSIHLLFSELQEKGGDITANNLMALTIINGKLKKLVAPDNNIFTEIKVLQTRFKKSAREEESVEELIRKHTIQKEVYFITSSQLEELSPSTFWKHISNVLTHSPSVQKVEIEGQGSFDRSDLLALINLEAQIPPQKLQKLINRLTERFFSLKESKKEDYTPLHLHVIAGREGDIATDLQKIAIDTPDTNGFSALQWACFLGNASIAAMLIHAGANSLSVLHEAVLADKCEVIEFLIENGADVNLQTKKGSTPLMAAAERGNETAVRALIEKGATVNLQNDEGWTALMAAAAYEREEVVRLLIEKGATVDLQDEDGETALMSAAGHGNKKAAQLLIENGAKVNLQNKKGYTALNLAAAHGQKKVVKLLIEKGAAVDLRDEEGWTPLISAAAHGQKKVVKLLIEKGATVDLRDEKGWTPLISAAAKGYKKVAGLLIENGAKVNLQTEKGSTALKLAAANGNEKVVELLITKGAAVNLGDEDGWTALKAAALGGNLQTVKLLLESHADVNLVDKEGHTLLYLLKAERPPHWQLMRQLIKTRSSPEICTHSKYLKQTLLLTQAFQFKGRSVIEGREIEWEGTQAEILVKTMADSIQLFSKKCRPFLDEITACHLAQNLQFTIDHPTASEILDRIRRGKSTFILTGFDGHAVTALLWEDLFVICNRGGGSSVPLEIHRFDRAKLDQDSLQLLLKYKERSLVEYVKAISVTLPQKLGFVQTENELKLQEITKLPKQIVGNCSWAANEGIIKAYLLLDKLKESSFKLPTEASDIQKLAEPVDNTFSVWLLFQLMHLLDKYLKRPVDPQLIFQSFNALWSAKSYALLSTASSPFLQKAFEEVFSQMLSDLETKFLATASPADALQFRTNKALFSVFPFPTSLPYLQGVLGTLSFIYSSKKSPNQTI